MKRTGFLGLLAIMLVFGFIGCDPNNGNGEPAVTETHSGTADSEIYVLKIFDDGTYELTVGEQTSTGTATKNGDTWTLTPTGKEPFYVTIGSSGVTGIEGKITFSDGSTKEPISITTGNGNDPFAGTWKGTIDSEPPSVFRFTALNSSFSCDAIDERFPSGVNGFFLGTYTVTGNTVNATITQVNKNVFPGADNILHDPEWVVWDSLDSELKTEFFGGSQTLSFSITGNKFTITSLGNITFTKQ